jgi:hypothetical protein
VKFGSEKGIGRAFSVSKRFHQEWSEPRWFSYSFVVH